jgi:hypothetical protein
MSQVKFNHVFTCLLLLSLVSAFVFPRKTSNVRAHVQGIFYPVAKPARVIASTIRGRMDRPTDSRPADTIVEENQRLKNTVANLSWQVEMLQARVAEGERLGPIEKWCKRVTVMGSDSGTRDSLSVVGSFDASLINQPALYEGGLAGTFERAGATGAQVRLVTDRSFSATGCFGTFNPEPNGGIGFTPKMTRAPLVEGLGRGVMISKHMEYKEAMDAKIGDGTWVVLEDKQFSQPVQRVKIGRVVSVKKRVESPLWADIELRPEYNLMALNAVMVFTKEGEREAPAAASARD